VKVTKEQILQKAISFFSSHDYDRSSLNEIAGALNITKGGIYHYFESKDDLFKESVSYLLDIVDQQASDSIELGIPLKKLLKSFFLLDDVAGLYSQMTGLDILGDYSDIVYLLFSVLKKFPEMRSKQERIYARYMMGMEMLFRDAQKRGEIRRDLDPEGLAFELTAFVEGGMLISSVSSGLDGNRLGTKVFDNFWKRIQSDSDDPE